MKNENEPGTRQIISGLQKLERLIAWVPGEAHAVCVLCLSRAFV